MTAALSKSAAALPLALASAGETVELVTIMLPDDEKQRLQELGLTPGTPLRIVKSDPTLGLIVAIRQDGRLALNHHIARKLLVRLGK